MLLITVNSILSAVFPFITFPYISRVLGVENIGKYNFAFTFVSYFVLIAGLGISTYAIREGASIRQSKADFKRFADQMFSINVCSTLVAYFLMVIVLFTVPKFRAYSNLSVIISFQILFTMLGLDWALTSYEDFLFVTIRNLVGNLLSIILLFVFVKNGNDLIKYTIIVVATTYGLNLINFFYTRRYYHPSFTLQINWSKHLKPIIVLFAMALTITVYVGSDITILGFFCNDRVVGYYSVSGKIYSAIKAVLSSVVLVAIPRLASLNDTTKRSEFTKQAEEVYKTLLTFVVPAIIGMIIFSKEIILMVAGEEFIEAVPSFIILSVTVFLCLSAYFWGQAVLVPLKKEKKVFIATIISAAANIILNIILIPLWQEKAAALTTLLSEGFAFVYCMTVGKKEVHLNGIYKTLGKIIIGCIAVIIVSVILKSFITNQIVALFASAMTSCVVYLIIELLMKNEVFSEAIQLLKSKFIK